MAEARSLLRRQLDRQRHRQQPEQRRELDDRVHRHRRGVLERIADRVAHHRRRVQRRPLHLQLDLDDLLGVVPGAAGVGHEDRLEQPEQRDRDQVADEEERLEERERQRREEHRQEDVEHPLLRVLRADLHDLLAVRDRRLRRPAVQLDVRLDELDRAVGAGADRLRRRAGEPVDHRAADDQAEQERRVQNRQLVDVLRQVAGQRHDDREDHRRRADDGRADQHRLGGRLERVAGAVVLLEQILGALEVHVEAVARA